MESVKVKHLKILTLVLIVLVEAVLNTYAATDCFKPAGSQGTFGQTTHVAAIVASFLPFDDTKRSRGVSRGWDIGFKREFQVSSMEVGKWKDNGGLLVVMFGAPSQQDISFLRYLKNIEQIDFNQLDYQSIVNLLVEYIRINGADAAELDRISANARAAIDAHPTLTRSQKQLLIESLLPNIPLNETSLSRGYLAGSCQCEARHLEDSRAQYRECQCWVRLSNTDLRRLTRRFIERADEVASSEKFITLYLAHWKHIRYGMLFKALDYPNAALQRVLNQKLTEELNSGRLQGSDVIRLSMFFTMVRDWENAEQAMDQFVSEQDSFILWLVGDLAKRWHFGVAKPVIQYGTTLPWVANKVWSGVKQLTGRQ